MSDQALSMPDFSFDEGNSSAKTNLRAMLGADGAAVVRTTEKLEKSGKVLEAYEKVQHHQLVQLQFDLLDSIDGQKLADASLRDIVGAFKILKDKELVSQGRPTEIHGLVGYLQILEEEEQKAAQPKTVDVTAVEEATLVENSAGDQLALFPVDSVAQEEEQLPCL